MKRFLQMLLFFCAALLCPSFANAGTEYLYTVNLLGTTEFSFTEQTLASSGDVTSGITQISGVTATEFIWDSADPTTCDGGGFFPPGDACAEVKYLINSHATGISYGFDPGSFLNTGSYTTPNFADVLTVTISAIPEPSTMLLFGAGLLGMIGTVRKRLLVK